LIRRRGALVTREDLRRELWADDTFVDFEHGLNAAIKRLRAVLGDSASIPRFIETLPRRGYRFIAEVEGSLAASPPTRPSWQRGVVAFTVVALLSVAGALVLWRTSSHRSESDLSGATPVRLTSTTGVNLDPALSPDGTLLAYASDRAGGGSLDIWVQPVGGGEPTRLTSDPADEAEPSFSPDGSHLVYSQREAGGIYVIAALGGEPRLVARALRARTPRYSPDGRWIAYWTGLSASVVATGSVTGSFFVVPSTGGPPRALQTGFANARYPVWAPDSDRILFLGERHDEPREYDWYVTSTADSDAIATGALAAFRTAGLVAAIPIPAAWQIRRGTVLCATSGPDSSNIWQIPISVSTGRVSGPPERVTFGSALERSPAVAASGSVAFTSISENVDLWRVPLEEDGGAASGAPDRLTDNAAKDSVPTVSRNGKIVAFISTRTDRGEVWVRDLETGRERQLTRGGAESASVSPDGSRVAFSTGTGTDTTGTVAVADVGSGLTTVLCDDCGKPWGWTPDGGGLLFSRGSPARVAVYDFSSGRQSEILGHPRWNLFQARVSPDGRWVAFHTTNAPSVRQIYIAPLSLEKRIPTESWIEVVSDSGVMPIWSRDGTSLYYFSFRDGAFCAWMQTLDPRTGRPAGAPRVVRHFHEPRLRAGFGASPTSDVQDDFLYVTLTETRANLWLIGGRR
jgi:Tol biopolymer transport system component